MSAHRFKVRVGEHHHAVDVDRAADEASCQVLVDGILHEVTRVAEDLYLVRAPGDPPQVAVSLGPGARPRHGTSSGVTVEMDIRTEQEVLVDAISGAGATDGASSTSTATAPMPGRVVRILVRPEDSVAAGDPLVIVEAMKMENELRSTVHGIVSRVAVTEGQTVDPGQVLCEIVPHVVSR